MAAYAMALAAVPDQPEIGANRTLPGTINALVVDYYRSAEWQHALAEDTRKTRQRIIERFRAKHGDKRVALLRREHIEKMLAEICEAVRKAPLAQSHPRTAAVRSPDHAQGRSNRRHRRYQAP